MVKQQGNIATPAVMITLLQIVSDPFMNNDVGNTDDDIFGYESMLQCILRWWRRRISVLANRKEDKVLFIYL